MLCYAKSLQSCPTLCDPIDGSPPGSAIPGILQARILEWVAISFSSAWKKKSESEIAQSCPTLSDPMNCSLPGSSVHGIFQARVLKWGAINTNYLVTITFSQEHNFPSFKVFKYNIQRTIQTAKWQVHRFSWSWPTCVTSHLLKNK